MSRQTPYFPLGGGLDVVTPSVQVPEGMIIAGDNFEPWINGGYRRIRGFERLDGRPAPSDATYTWLTLADSTGLATGTTLTGDTSSATGVVVAIEGNEVAVTKVSGTFQAEDVNTSAFTITDTRTGAPTIALESAWQLAAENEYRDDIAQVPGVNEIRGIWQNRSAIYAFRDNAGETACIIHKATSSGWDATPIEYAHTVRFDAGTAEFTEGQVLTGGTSGATGTIHRIILFGGSFSGNDAFGYLALTSVTGTFADNETITDAASGSATADGDSEQFALPVGGRYDFITANFFASPTTYRLYGCQGAGPAFEIDENEVVTPILLDLSFGDAPAENNPYLVEEFDGALWLMFPGGSLQKSVTGSPLQFNGFLGAAEFGLGDEGTGLVNSAGKILVAFTRRQVHGITPTDVSYSKRLLSDRSGCILHTAEEIDTIYALDDSGIVDLQRAERFGDFANATVSDGVQPILENFRDRAVGVVAIRETNQFRLLFDNGTGVMMRRRADGAVEFGTLKFDLGAETIFCCYTCEDENSKPRYFFGGSDGFVYEMERGMNFDGAAIESFMRLPFLHNQSPAVMKRFRLAEVEVQCERNVTLLMLQDRDFGNPVNNTTTWEDPDVLGGGGVYDLANWDEAFWDARLANYARFELYGSGRNLSLLIYNESATTSPFILQGVILHFDPRRQTR